MMTRCAVGFAAALLMAGCAGMFDGKQDFRADLTGAQEVPPVSTNGRGFATATLDDGILTFSVNYNGLTGPATAAHFHGPASAGTNAGVQIPIGQGATAASPIAGTAKVTDQQAADLRAGRMYVNIHTAAHPNGEIRGQVLPAK